MTTFNVDLDQNGILQVSFGEPADNDIIVQDCAKACEKVKDQVMGKVLRINGRASVPAAFVLAHAFCHIVPAIAVQDPKVGKFVVAISHSPDFQVGQLID